jgi:hypothetical protein
VSVEGLDGSLESPELHHSVGDLSGPQRNQTLVETSDTFSLDDLTHTLSIELILNVSNASQQWRKMFAVKSRIIARNIASA